jgi:hypothetical protein
VRLTSTLRARYHDSLNEVKLAKPGETIENVFDRFPFFSRQIARGSPFAPGAELSELDLSVEEL